MTNLTTIVRGWVSFRFSNFRCTLTRTIILSSSFWEWTKKLGCTYRWLGRKTGWQEVHWNEVWPTHLSKSRVRVCIKAFPPFQMPKCYAYCPVAVSVPESWNYLNTCNLNSYLSESPTFPFEFSVNVYMLSHSVLAFLIDSIFQNIYSRLFIRPEYICFPCFYKRVIIHRLWKYIKFLSPVSVRLFSPCLWSFSKISPI